MNLYRIIESLEPGHFASRERVLNRRRDELLKQGYYPQPVTGDDIRCFWLRFETLNGGISPVADSSAIELYQEFLRYDPPT